MGIGIGLALGIPPEIAKGPFLSPLVLAYIIRVEADGGVVESPECIDENL